MPFVTSLVLLIAVAVDSRESACPFRRRPQPDNESNAGDAGVRKTQLGPGVRDRREKLRRREAADRRNRRRSARVEAATQPRDGCAAGMRKGRGAGRTPTRVFEGPKRQMRSNHCECVLRGDHRESEAQSFRSDPWAAVRRARLNPMQPVPDSVDGNPPGFSARNAGKARK